MIRARYYLIVMACSGVIASLTAEAHAGTNESLGTIASLDGKVLISSGDGFTDAVPNQRIAAHDRVLVSLGARVSLSFATCNLSLTPGTIHIISPTPCANASQEPEITTASTSAPPESPPESPPATLSTAQLKARQVNLHRLHNDIQRQLEAARDAHDPVRTQCIADALAEITVLNRIHDGALAAYFKAVAAKDGEAVANATIKMGTTVERANQASAAASTCQGEMVELRTATVDVIRDEGLGTSGAAPATPPSPPAPPLQINGVAVATTTLSVAAVGLSVVAVKTLAEKSVSAP
jgi:hypothetical protein